MNRTIEHDEWTVQDLLDALAKFPKDSPVELLTFGYTDDVQSIEIADGKDTVYLVGRGH